MLKANIASKRTNLLKTLSAKIYQFASTSQLIVRKSRSFKPEVFLLALIKATQQGRASLHKIVMQMEELDPQCSISPQALWKRINRENCFLDQFLSLCCALITAHGVVEAKRHACRFGRILTEDSSFIKILKSCANTFPAHGNRYGSTAGLKLNFIFDILTGESLELSTHYATTQDRSIAYDIIALLKKGDLVLRDMGYFLVNAFDLIESKGADWLSRVPMSVEVFLEDGSKLEEILDTSRSGYIDRKVELTDDRKKARLVAIAKSPEDAQKAVRELREKYKKEGKTPSNKALKRARWYVLATSVSKEVMSAAELSKLYAQRWQIEIVFKAWKQSSNLEKSLCFKSSYQHILGVFLAEVLRLTLIMRSYSIERSSRNREEIARISIMKLGDIISTKINNAHNFKELLGRQVFGRSILTQKRNRKNLVQSMLELLG